MNRGTFLKLSIWTASKINSQGDYSSLPFGDNCFLTTNWTSGTLPKLVTVILSSVEITLYQEYVEVSPQGTSVIFATGLLVIDTIGDIVTVCAGYINLDRNPNSLYSVIR